LSNPRIAYELADERATLAPPGGKPLIVHVVVNVEVWPFDQPMPRGILSPPHGAAAVPDVPNWSWAEYGLRAGMPRLFRALRGIPVTCAINSDVIKTYPLLAARILYAGWEWMGHGVIHRSVKSIDDERAMITQAVEAIGAFTGTRVRGWLGPGLQETYETPDVLKELGLDYVCEWCLDDTPSWMTTRHGPLVSIPYGLETNDSVIYAQERHPTSEMFERLDLTLECYSRETADAPRILHVPLHPHLAGVPHRIGRLERFLEALRRRDEAVFMNGGAIADWFASAQPAPRA
jgi:peptidoglycan/xylan/chitin deacetylase (PgdA/CDA1 family)